MKNEVKAKLNEDFLASKGIASDTMVINNDLLNEYVKFCKTRDV